MFKPTPSFSLMCLPRTVTLGLIIAALGACTAETTESSSNIAISSSESVQSSQESSSVVPASSASSVTPSSAAFSSALSSLVASSSNTSSVASSAADNTALLTVIEAENYDAASQVQPFESQTDDGRTIMVWPSTGEQNTEALDNGAGQLFYSIVASASSMTLYATVNFSDATNDSFFYKLEGKDTAWAAQNNVSTAGYEELEIATWNGLASGQAYTLKIQRREDGAKLDSFRLEGGGFAYGQEGASSSVATSSSVAISSVASSSAPIMNGGTFKHRIINTSDIHPNGDPDDWQSMVRQLVMSDMVDIEGLIPTTGCWVKNQNGSGMNLLNGILDAYEQSYNNLKVHGDFPTPAYLRSISVPGQTGYAMGGVGAGKDSPGSELIINAVDKDDPRPVWATCWGGCNTIAQAVWKVQNTRSKAELDKFISKLRVYDVLGQGEAGNWLAKTFPNLLYIRATGVYGWQEPKNGSYFQQIQSLGPLGAKFPDTKYAPEGDTPAFMHLVQPGLNDPEDITQGGWGGRFSATKTANIKGMSCMNSGAYNTHYMHGNLGGAGAIKKWNAGYNNDFLARMQWSTTSNYNAVNHHPIIVLNGQEKMAVMYMDVQAGTTVALDASASRDPDNNSLNYSWEFYKDPSSYGGSVSISGTSISSVQIPSDARGKTIHIILTLKDNGSPSLTAYRRVVMNIK